MALIPFSAFEPDRAETNGVSANILNAILRLDESGVAYGPCKGIAVTPSATALPAAPKGGVSLVDRAGNYFAFLGTSSGIYKFNADSTFTSIGSGFSLTSGDRWSMIGFGEFLLASNTTDGVWQYNVETGGAMSAVANSYYPRILFTAFDCIFAGNCIDGTGVRDNRLLRNSAINDYATWTPGVRGAGTQVFPDGEEVTGGCEISQNLAILFQRNAIRALRRTGDQSIYAVETIVTGEGAVNPWCICPIGGVAYFIDTDGFKAVSAGGVKKIGDEKVDRWFLSMLAAGGLDNVEGAVDPSNKRIVWRYQSQTADATVFQDAIAFHYTIGEFVPLSITTTAILSMGTPAYDMDTMDSIWPDMDDPTMPDMDSRYWAGGEPRLFALDSSYKGGFFDGDNLATTLETGTINSSSSALLRSLTPITDAAGGTVAIGKRDSLGAAKTYTGEFVVQASGRVPVRARGKNLSARLTIPAGTDWNFARGVDHIELTAGGPR